MWGAEGYRDMRAWTTSVFFVIVWEGEERGQGEERGGKERRGEARRERGGKERKGRQGEERGGKERKGRQLSLIHI